MDLYYSKNYDNNEFMLIEVPEKVLEEIESNNNINNSIENNIIIKGNEISILCTPTKSFELKYVETSNSLLKLENKIDNFYPEKTYNQLFLEEVIKNNIGKSDSIEKIQNNMDIDNNTNANNNNINPINKSISFITNHTLECIEITPKKNIIYSLLRNKASLSYDLKTGNSNINNLDKIITYDYLFSITELCKKDYDDALNYFNIVKKGDRLFVFDFKFVMEIIKDIVLSINSNTNNISFDYNVFTLDDVFSNNIELINLNKNYSRIISELSYSEKKSLLLYISIQNSDDTFSLNETKIKNFCVKNIFIKENKYNLTDFVKILKEMYNITFPFKLLEQVNKDDITYCYNEANLESNLFEYYKDMNLSFMKGNAIIVFLKTKREPIIQFIDETTLSEKFEMRLKELFDIKDKWLMSELKIFFSDIKNLNEKIQKYCKQYTEANPFDNTKNVTYYKLKFKL